MNQQEIVKRVLAKLDQYETELGLHDVDLLNTLHLKSGQKRIHLVVGVSIAVLLLTLAIFGVSFLSNLVAFYPLYSSFKALRTPSVDDDKYWLTYWVVYGSLSLMESLIDKVFFWLPLYYVIKIVFLVWCFHPSTKGALVVYQRVLGPLFVGVQREVGELHSEVADKGKRASVQHAK